MLLKREKKKRVRQKQARALTDQEQLEIDMEKLRDLSLLKEMDSGKAPHKGALVLRSEPKSECVTRSSRHFDREEEVKKFPHSTKNDRAFKN